MVHGAFYLKLSSLLRDVHWKSYGGDLKLHIVVSFKFSAHGLFSLTKNFKRSMHELFPKLLAAREFFSRNFLLHEFFGTLRTPSHYNFCNGPSLIFVGSSMKIRGRPQTFLPEPKLQRVLRLN